MTFAHGETVTRQRGTAIIDPYSGETTGISWATPSLLAIPGCGIASGGSLEPLQDARNAVDSDYDVIAPYGSDILAGDRVVIRGLTCDVAGRPFDWRSPFTGWAPGTLVQAKIREG